MVEKTSNRPWVKHSEAIRYGMGLLVYIFMYGLLAGVFFWGGIYLYADGSFMLGSVAYFIGALFSLAGFLGIFYKVIADGVYTGIRNAGNADREIVESETTEQEGNGELELTTSYDDENGRMKLTVENSGGADFLDIVVDGEVRETLSSPKLGDEVVVDKKPSESVEVTRRSYGR